MSSYIRVLRGDIHIIIWLFSCVLDLGYYINHTFALSLLSVPKLQETPIELPPFLALNHPFRTIQTTVYAGNVTATIPRGIATQLLELNFEDTKQTNARLYFIGNVTLNSKLYKYIKILTNRWKP